MNAVFSKHFFPAALASLIIIWSDPGLAQGVDPNIQVQADYFVSRPADPVIRSETKRVLIVRPVFETVREERTLTTAQRRQLLEATLKKQGLPLPQLFTKMTDRDLHAQFTKYQIPERQTVSVLKQTGTTKEYAERPQPRMPEINFSVAGNYNYESNANKSSTNRILDRIAIVNESVLLKLPIGTVEDTLALFGAATSARYNSLTTKNLDTLDVIATYSTLLWKTPGSKLDGITTRDILAFSFEALSLHQATFASTIANLYIPSIQWSRNNLPLSDQRLGEGRTEAFRYFANVLMALKYTASDVSKLENTAARLETTLGWRTSITGLTVMATGGLQGNYYTHVVGGRQDFIYDLATKIEWKPSNFATLSAGFKFAQQMSSPSIFSWNGYILSPQIKLTIKF